MTLEIRLLGPLEVRVSGAPLVVDTRKASAILALLATDGRPFARDELAALLWPDADDESARGALRRTLSTLRAGLGDRGLVVDRANVALDARDSWVDLAEATRLSASDQPEDLALAAELHRGPFLAGFSLRDSPPFDDWQAARTVEVARRLTTILDRLSAARLATGDVARALEAARRLVAVDPLDEGGQRRLIDLLARTGDRAGAIRQYRACVAVLDTELGVPPLPETTAIYEAIRDERPEPIVIERNPRSVDRPAGSGTLPLVGRAAEFALLLDLHGTATTDGRLAVVEGEAGIGKSRLVGDVATAVAGAGGPVLVARCYAGEQAVAYAPLVTLLRGGAAVDGTPARLAALSPLTRAELARLLPDIEAPAAPPDIEPSAARVRFLEAITDGISALTAGASPGIVWIEDLHRADAATAEAIVYLAHRLKGRPFLLVVTWRREELDGVAATSAAALERAADAHVRLGRLDRAEVAELVDPNLADAMYAQSEGLPLFIVESLAARAEGAGLEPDRVPTGIRALIAERLASVGGVAGQVLAAAAVIGRSFDFESVRQVGGRGDEEAVDAIDELLRRGFLRETSVSSGRGTRFDFTHGSIRDVTYESTSLVRRRLLHRRAAESLAGRPVTALADPDVVARLPGPEAATVASHLRAAGLDESAALAFSHAARHARSVHAIADALEQFEAALALGHPQAGRLHVEIGDLRTLTGAYGPAIAHYETAAALTPIDDAATLAAIEHRLALVHQRRGDPAAAEGHFVAALDASLGPAAEARLLADRSLNAFDDGRTADASRLAADALAQAEASGDPAAIARAANVAGVLATESGELAAGTVHLERSLSLAAATHDEAAHVAALNNLARAVAARGEVERAIALTEEALTMCTAIGDRHRAAALHNNLADLFRATGRRDAAMDHLMRAVAIFADVGEPDGLEPGKWRLATW